MKPTKHPDRWSYEGKVLNTLQELPQHEFLEGFVYKITNTKNGKFYIGKKSFYTNRKKKISSREKKSTRTRKTYKQVIKESDWQTYYGSSIVLKNEILQLGTAYFKREILEICCTKKYLNFCELSWQIKLDVLKTNSYNGNILGRYYSRDMENCVA